MPWELEIHHIDIGQGDSTLIFAKDTAVPANNRAALIDGGLVGQGSVILDYLGNLGITKVNVMVASHYDKDHFGGLRYLLKHATTTIFDNTVIVDRGEQGDVDNHGVVTGMNRRNEYLEYLNFIALKPNRKRITDRLVSAYNSAAGVPPGWSLGRAFLNTEILWRNNNPNLVVNGNPVALGDPIAKTSNDAPTITCIAADYYLLDENDQVVKQADGQGDAENRLCLAFVVKFNNFRYYTGGDLESPQETVIARHLNKTNNNAGRISAFKVSHHGSAKSTTLPFANRLGASAAIIPVGQSATFGTETLPTQQAINNLQNCAAIQNYYLTGIDPNIDRNHIEEVNENVLQAGKSRVAGGYERKRVQRAMRRVERRGHIVLEVTQNQSTQNPATFSVSYWNTNLGMIDTIAH
jgi:beta-lactamase superfamily II metal-dependent hydrolase